MAPITTATTPTAPNAELPTVNPTIAPKAPRKIATMCTAFRVKLPPADPFLSWYPHEGQLSTVSEIDFEHSGHSIKAISIILSCQTSWLRIRLCSLRDDHIYFWFVVHLIKLRLVLLCSGGSVFSYFCKLGNTASSSSSGTYSMRSPG